MTQAEHLESAPGGEYTTRQATCADQAAVTELFNLDPRSERLDDDGADVLDLSRSYLSEGQGSCLWVAEAPGGEIVGMVAVKRADESVAQIRRLRVRADWRQKGIGAGLVRQAIAFCTDNGYVKVILSTRVEQEAAIALFRFFGFQHNRTRTIEGRETMEFYLDLYRQSERDRG